MRRPSSCRRSAWSWAAARTCRARSPCNGIVPGCGFTRRGMMVPARRTFAILLALAAGVPGTAFAQAIAGTVHDASGAAVADVTVEATSAALMERFRTVVSDGSGQYRIEGQRPGGYTITFPPRVFLPYVRVGVVVS